MPFADASRPHLRECSVRKLQAVAQDGCRDARAGIGTTAWSIRPLDSIRSERNFRTRRPKAAQVAVTPAWQEAQHANVTQRDNPTWISSFPRAATCLPETLEQRKNKSSCEAISCQMLRSLLDQDAVQSPVEMRRSEIFLHPRYPLIRPQRSWTALLVVQARGADQT